MSLLKSPWFWGSTAIGLLFMNSRSQGQAPSATPSAPGTTPTPTPKPAPKPAPKAPPLPKPKPAPTPAPSFQTLAIPPGSAVNQAVVNGHLYTFARLGGGVFIMENERAFIKFDQDIGAKGPLATGAATQADMDQLLTDFQASENMALTPFNA